jgi:hypothetical protein
MEKLQVGGVNHEQRGEKFNLKTPIRVQPTQTRRVHSWLTKNISKVMKLRLKNT